MVSWGRCEGRTQEVQESSYERERERGRQINEGGE